MKMANRALEWGQRAGGRELCYDLVMEHAIDSLLRAIEGYDPARGRFSTLACRIILRQVKRGLAKETEALSVENSTCHRKGRPKSTALSLDAVPDWLPSSHTDPVEHANEVEQLVAEVCTPRECQLLHDIYWRGMTAKEAGRRVGLSHAGGPFVRDVALQRLRVRLRARGQPADIFASE